MYVSPSRTRWSAPAGSLPSIGPSSRRSQPKSSKKASQAKEIKREEDHEARGAAPSGYVLLPLLPQPFLLRGRGSLSLSPTLTWLQEGDLELAGIEAFKEMVESAAAAAAHKTDTSAGANK